MFTLSKKLRRELKRHCKRTRISPDAAIQAAVRLYLRRRKRQSKEFNVLVY